MIKLDLETIVRLCNSTITKDIWYKDTECTKRFNEQFSKLGEDLGCRAQYSGHPNEFFKIDMVWWLNGRMAAAIEHENKPKTNPIEDEWRKLTYIDADYRILISYRKSKDEREKWVKRAGEIVAGNTRGDAVGYFLILGDETFWGFRGYEFDHLGNKIKGA